MESSRETGSGVSSSATSSSVDRRQEIQRGGRDHGQTGEVSETASTVARHVKETVSSVASTANYKVQEVLDQQVGKGAEVIGNIASSIRAAAGDLEGNSPQLAGLVRGTADRVDAFSEAVRGKSAGELISEGADFARRQPAIVFGAMALLGFGLYRLFGTRIDTDAYNQRQQGSKFGGEGETEIALQPSESTSPTSRLKVYRSESSDAL